MKLVLTVDEFSELLKSIQIPALGGRRIRSVEIPSRYSSNKDVEILFDDAEIEAVSEYIVPMPPPTAVVSDTPDMPF